MQIHAGITSYNTPSALGVLHVMRCINVRYLLTYLQSWNWIDVFWIRYDPVHDTTNTNVSNTDCQNCFGN